jgi:hypothetical protein
MALRARGPVLIIIAKREDEPYDDGGSWEDKESIVSHSSRQAAVRARLSDAGRLGFNQDNLTFPNGDTAPVIVNNLATGAGLRHDRAAWLHRRATVDSHITIAVIDHDRTFNDYCSLRRRTQEREQGHKTNGYGKPERHSLTPAMVVQDLRHVRCHLTPVDTI